jgi:hypothetical protein
VGCAHGSSTSCLGCFVPRPRKQRRMAAHEAVASSRSERKSSSASGAEAPWLRCMRRESQLVSRVAFLRAEKGRPGKLTADTQPGRPGAGIAGTDEICALTRAPKLRQFLLIAGIADSTRSCFYQGMVFVHISSGRVTNCSICFARACVSTTRGRPIGPPPCTQGSRTGDTGQPGGRSQPWPGIAVHPPPHALHVL